MLLKMSFSGGILILFIMLLRFLAINKLPKKLFVLLWEIVLFRLLLPVDLPMRYGIASPVVKMAGSGIDALAAAGSHSSQGKAGEFIGLERTGNAVGIDWAWAVWLAGAVTLFAVFGVLYLREYQRIQEALPVSREAESCLRLLADIPERIKLLASDRISTPLTFGILSPKIVLSKALKTTDATQLKYVLTHEMVHIKRADNLWKNIMLPGRKAAPPAVVFKWIREKCDPGKDNSNYEFKKKYSFKHWVCRIVIRGGNYRICAE